MKFDITVNDPLLEPFLPVIRRRHERSVLKELEFTNRKKRLADIFNNHLYFDSEEIGLHPKTSHPLFDKYFNRENYYDCGEEESPFGNDNGSDTLS